MHLNISKLFPFSSATSIAKTDRKKKVLTLCLSGHTELPKSCTLKQKSRLEKIFAGANKQSLTNTLSKTYLANSSSAPAAAQ